MPYLFKCQDTADVLMLAPSAERLLALMGKPAAPQGTVTVAALPAAILALQAAADDPAAGAAAAVPTPMDAPDPARDDDEPVTLRQTALPLIAMFKQALQAQQPVVWGT